MKVGHGGDKIISTLLNLDAHTVAKGRKELLDQEVEVKSIRRPGGGRKSIEKKTPTIIEEIKQIMAYEVAGDLMTELKWTKKTTQKSA